MPFISIRFFFVIATFALIPISYLQAEDTLKPLESPKVAAPSLDLAQQCWDSLKGFPGFKDEALLKKACAQVKVFEACQSVQSVPIFHYEKNGSTPEAKRILVFSLIHGDETGAGTVGRFWMQNLERISPRNSWRVIPVLNPDGVKLKTRTNANKIDLNRNFPTADWNQLAASYWEKTTSKNPRRFPGPTAGSEPEVKCAVSHIVDFKPDFVVSIHTPLNVLDFDGPQVKPPPYDYLPWRSLGHFPGSLGRYLWLERQTPVLTMELKNEIPKSLNTFERLQDVIGTLVKYEVEALKKN